MQNILEVSPNQEIKFELVTGKTLERTLLLRNKTDDPVVFKVKTTAPKRYCVRPNCSVIKGGDAVEVKIVMQPIRELPNPPNSWKDKFLIQAGALADGQENHELSGDPKALFDVLDKPQILDHKLMCKFDVSSDSGFATTATATHTESVSTPGAGPSAPAAVKVEEPTRGSPDHDAGAGKSGARERDLEQKLALERRLAEKLERELEGARDRERKLKQAVEDEREQNKEVVRALENLQAKFENMQRQSIGGVADKKASGGAGGQHEVSTASSTFQNFLISAIVVLLAIVAGMILFPQGQAALPPPPPPRASQSHGQGQEL